jgi:hypothetical protein
MKCVLHIGTEKTGTTSIQRALKEHRPILASHRILYPKLFYGLKHIKISCFAMDNDRIDIRKRRLGLTDDEAIERFRQEFRRDFAKEIAANQRGTTTVVIVNEHLSRLRNASEVERLKDFLDGFFDAIELHLYIRRQDLLMRSMYSTVIKVGGLRQNVYPVFKDEGPNEDFITFDYHRMFKLWGSVFPKERLHIHRFDRSTLLGDNAIPDFLIRSGLLAEDAARQLIVDTENASLDPLALEVLRRFNVAWQRHGYARSGIAGMGTIFAELFPGGGKPVSRGEAEEFLSHFAESNGKLARGYFGSDQLFDAADLEALPDKVEPAVPTVEDTLRILSAVWQTKMSRKGD